MKYDMAAARERAQNLGMLIDLNALRERILGREGISSSWILLTALVKGDDTIQKRILNAVGKDHFSRMAYMQDEIFQWITQSIESRGYVDIGELYHNMETYVRYHVLSEQRGYLDQVLAIETPSAADVDRALRSLSQQQSSYADLPSERIVLAALVKSGPEIRQHVLNELDPNEHIRASSSGEILNWITELLETKGQVDEHDLHNLMEQFVFDKLAPVYIGNIDHLLAVDAPDADLIDKAIVNLQTRYARSHGSLH